MEAMNVRGMPPILASKGHSHFRVQLVTKTVLYQLYTLCQQVIRRKQEIMEYLREYDQGALVSFISTDSALTV